jgi:hypothetical protein
VRICKVDINWISKKHDILIAIFVTSTWISTHYSDERLSFRLCYGLTLSMDNQRWEFGIRCVGVVWHKESTLRIWVFWHLYIHECREWVLKLGTCERILKPGCEASEANWGYSRYNQFRNDEAFSWTGIVSPGAVSAVAMVVFCRPISFQSTDIPKPLK